MSERMRARGLPDIIYMGMNPWDSICQRPQHLATGLSQWGRVLFVDPVTPSWLGDLRRALTGARRRPWGPRLKQLDASLYHLVPPPGVPFGFDSRVCNHANQKVQSLLVRQMSRRLGFQRPVLWVDHPLETHQTGQHGESLVVYNCMDNYPAFWSARPRRRRLVEALEREMLAQADLVLASSRGLVRRCASANDVRYVPNACDAAFFAQGRGAPYPEILRPMRRPLLGYVGTVSHWVDLCLVARVAADHPEADIVMVGPVENVDLAPCEGLENMRFLGPIPYAQVPAYINAFDICLIPFEENPLTADVDPIKAYEYLAMGKPVVAVGLPELERYGDLIYLARGREEAAQKLAMALDEVAHGALPGLVARRQRVAFENTWEDRVEAVAELIRERGAEPRRQSR